MSEERVADLGSARRRSPRRAPDLDAVVRQPVEVRWNRVTVRAAARHRPALWAELGRFQERIDSSIADWSAPR
ncbi:MAG: hypothetical protein KJS90_07480 [Acidobacteria bacterium]|nr:hypothetical protein [Acidobacteriota bacterium]